MKPMEGPSLSCGLQWWENECAPALKSMYGELVLEERVCTRLASKPGQKDQRFAVYAEMAREAMGEIQVDWDEGWAVAFHPRVRAFRLIVLGARALDDGSATIEDFLCSEVGLGGRSGIYRDAEARVFDEGLWEVIRRLDGSYKKLELETTEEISVRSPFFWRCPPANSQVYFKKAVHLEFRRIEAQFGTQSRLGAADRDRFEVDRRAASRLSTSTDWKRMKRDECDPVEELISGHDSGHAALMLLRQLERVVHDDRERLALHYIARGMNSSEATRAAGLSRSAFRALQYRAQKYVSVS